MNPKHILEFSSNISNKSELKNGYKENFSKNSKKYKKWIDDISLKQGK